MRYEIIIELQINRIAEKERGREGVRAAATTDVAGVTKSVVSRNPFLDDGKTHKIPSRLVHVLTKSRTLVSLHPSW